mgnify:CR=1 FL=1
MASSSLDRFRITGGCRLEGEVSVTGAKNSVLKLMAASLLAVGTTTIRNVPDIATLIQPESPTREISLPRRSLRDCLSEDLRRLDPDDAFGHVLLSGFGPKSAKLKK